MRVLLTGASGMVGANLAHRLVEQGCEPFVLLRSEGVPARLAPIVDRVKPLQADLLDGDAVAAAVAQARPDVTVHLAGTPFNPPPTARLHFDVNVLGAMNLMAALSARGSGRVIFTGTAAQYGSGDGLRESDPDRPDTLLGISKQCAAETIHGYGRMARLETVEIRLFTPFGPWERPGRLIPHVILSGLRGDEVRLGEGRQERDWLYVDDAVSALVSAMSAPLPSGILLNVCSGRGVAVRDVATRILALMDDPAPLRLGALPTRADEIWKLSGDNSLARKMLDWRPEVTLEEGLRSTIDWFRTHRTVAERLS